MNPNTAPKLPDPDFVPQNWPELAAHYFQCVNALDYSTAQMRGHAGCPRFGPVVGPASASGSACIAAGIILCKVMERDMREKRWQDRPRRKAT